MALQIPESWLHRPVRVWLIGAGGTGSHLFGALAALDHALRALGHPGGLHVTVFDPDRVREANIGRQAFWPGEIGQNKAETLIQRINLTLGLDWVAVPHRFALRRIADSACDLLITAVDRASVRADLGRRTQALSRAITNPIGWLDAGNDEHEAQVVLGHWRARTGAGWVPNVFQLYPELATFNEAHRAPSCSAADSLARQALPINRIVADIALTLLWRLFREGRLDTHGAFVDLATLSVRPLRADPQIWASFGWPPRR
ncbi:MAG: PRTRC system ThiF family protein [Candidatus Competibacteraceae bacterium]|nr:PRTRC system ThiF family protein [Candidatus Competibacteraceae bacterium]